MEGIISSRNRCCRGRVLWILIQTVVECLCFAASGYCDWIKGYFSPAAKIDSIQRIAHIVDTKDSTYLGITIVPAGDINGDGFQDIILCREKFQTTGRDDSAFIYLGGNPPSTVPYRGFANLSNLMVNIGDVNGDGYPDFAVQKFYPSSGATQIEIFFGGPSMRDTADFIIPHTYSAIPKAVDLDGDGELELALGDYNQGFVKIYDVGPARRDTIPKYIIPDTSLSYGENLVVGDFNGDGWPDLAVAAFLNRIPAHGALPFVKFYWGGPGFDTVADFEIQSQAAQFGKLMVNVGHFNGGNYDDIFISGGSNNPYGVYYGGPTIDDKLDLCVNWPDFFVPTSADVAGDVNHDGYPDLVIGDEEAGSGFLEVFSGGPHPDSLRAVYVDFTQFPRGEGHSAFGHMVKGVGDMNGDGIDDFAAFSVTQTVIGRGEVDVFAGWNSTVTNIRIRDRASNPESFSLYTAYPNPFNPSTTISFDLTRRVDVKLTVIDMAGRLVRTLVDRTLPSGNHRVRWNALDDNGRFVASGVYLARLQAGVQESSIKLVLLR